MCIKKDILGCTANVWNTMLRLITGEKGTIMFSEDLLNQSNWKCPGTAFLLHVFIVTIQQFISLNKTHIFFFLQIEILMASFKKCRFKTQLALAQNVHVSIKVLRILPIIIFLWCVCCLHVCFDQAYKAAKRFYTQTNNWAQQPSNKLPFKAALKVWRQ